MARPSKRLLSEDDITQPGPLKDAFNSITPASIGAASASHAHDASEVGAIGVRTGFVSEGSADDLIEPGTYFISGVMTPANGWPNQPNRWGTVVVTVDPANRIVQWAVSNGGEVIHVRYFGTGNVWCPWKRLVTDDDPRVYDSGERNVASLLKNGWALYNSSIPIRLARQANLVTLTVPALSLDGTAASADAFLTLPPGFRIATSGNYGGVGLLSTASGAPEWVSKAMSNLTSSHRGRLDGILMWRTSDPVPSTLPGTPA